MAEERFEDVQEDKDATAVPRKYQYVWDIRYIHATVLRDEDTDADNDCGPYPVRVRMDPPREMAKWRCSVR